MNDNYGEKISKALVALREKHISIDEKKFNKWVSNKATSLFMRDKNKAEKRGENFEYERGCYVEAICNAILTAPNPERDFYTGSLLDWGKIGTFKNEAAMQGGKKYKQDFANLPTVDHKNAELKPDFVICSWRVNDAKNDLSIDEFIMLCSEILKHAGFKVDKE